MKKSLSLHDSGPEIVQDIGGAVSALDTTLIEREGITDFDDIAARIPGLNLNDRGPNQNDVGIRGVANGAMQGLSDTGLSGPLVSQFLDDIPTGCIYGQPTRF